MNAGVPIAALATATGPPVRDYLARIGLPLPTGALPPPTLGTLRAVHRAHMLSIPFENLDLFVGRPVRIDAVEHPWRKLVDARRGGWCHEHIMVAAEALDQLGFDVRLCAGHVIIRGEDASPVGTHAVAIASGGALGGRQYVIDVGYPDSALEPLCIDDDALGLPQWSTAGRAFAVTRQVDDAGDTFIYRWSLPLDTGHTPENPPDMSSFDPIWRFRVAGQPDLHSLRAGNEWVQAAEASVFRRNLLATLPRAPRGRVTLSGMRCIETDTGWRKTTREVPPEELIRILRNDLGIDWPDPLDRQQGQGPAAESPIASICI